MFELFVMHFRKRRIDMKFIFEPRFLFLLFFAGLNKSAYAQEVINDTLTGAYSNFKWASLNGACLTAGNNTGSIPACVGLKYYENATQVGGTTGRLPDAVGKGALRLTNGDFKVDGNNGDYKTGAVVSDFTFASNKGIQVTFTTVTYGGDNLSGHGADGISFFLMDGANSPSVGGLGGSLGYSCSNGNDTYDGVAGGYIGIGIDEYGNFSNSGDNTDTGSGFKAGRISLRGAGDTSFASLTKKYSKYYPASLGDNESDRKAAVQNTCRTGYVWNFSGTSLKDANGKLTPNKSQTTEKLAFNYPWIVSSDFPPEVSIANQQGLNKPLRDNATKITYAVKITQDGLLDFSYSVNNGITQPVESKRRITDSNGPLPKLFRFGFSGGTGSGSNVHEITCFKAAPVDESSSSAGTNVQQSARVEAGTQVYLAYYHPTNAWGQLTAQNIMSDATGDNVFINPLANWDASCTLTGGSCGAMGNGVSITAQTPDSRKILSWNGTSGIPFRWSNLSAAQKNNLTAGETANDDRLQYLRGDRSDEVAKNGVFRTRTGILGDIIGSSPTWVGSPSLPYGGTWADALYAGVAAPEKNYKKFKSDYATRQNVVYVGANDGMLHGFRAGAYNTSGDFYTDSAKPNDGQEILAYVPNTVLSTMHSSSSPALDFSNTQYSHNFYVDATPGTGDLYYDGAWHTWLVGGYGAGGNPAGPVGDKTSTSPGGIFALDITDPAAFSESAASSLVVGEWSSSTILCANVLLCKLNLGASYGTPSIRRLHNGNWAVLFGNGLNSSKGTAGLFVMLIDSSGGKTFRYIDTGYGPSNDPTGNNSKNGIAYVSPVDLDGDLITDYVYAGDAFGNLWRFDLTSDTPSSWSVSSTPIFSTQAGRPITSQVAVGTIAGVGSGGLPRVMVSFGTGQQLPQTLTSEATYATGTQALYGIWDWNLKAWNSKAGGAAQFASLPTVDTVAPTSVLTAASLLAQSITATAAGKGSVSGYRAVSQSKVCWNGSKACATGNTKYGWTLPLPSSNEQVIYNPVLAYGMFAVNTTIPGTVSALTCDSQPASGFTMAVMLATGGSGSQSFFPDPSNQFVPIPDSSGSGGLVSGIGLNATGTPSIVTSKKRPFFVQQNVSGDGVVTGINPGAAGSGGRLNWIRYR